MTWCLGRRPLAIREPEAEVIREATRQVLAGADPGSDRTRPTSPAHAPRWAGRGTTSRCVTWCCARNAALIHNGRPGRFDFEEVGPCGLARDRGRGSVARGVRRPDRAVPRAQKSTRMKWPGTNIYTCGRCGAPMRVAPHSQTKRYHYRGGEQAHLSFAVADTDRRVHAVVAEKLRDPRLVAALTEPDPRLDEYRARRKNLEAKLARIEADHDAGHRTGAVYRAKKDRAQTDLGMVDQRMGVSAQRTRCGR